MFVVAAMLKVRWSSVSESFLLCVVEVIERWMYALLFSLYLLYHKSNWASFRTRLPPCYHANAKRSETCPNCTLFFSTATKQAGSRKLTHGSLFCYI